MILGVLLRLMGRACEGGLKRMTCDPLDRFLPVDLVILLPALKITYFGLSYYERCVGGVGEGEE